MLTWLLAVAAPSIALGYFLGRARPIQRLNERLYVIWYDGQQAGRRDAKYYTAQACFALLVCASAAARPRQSYRAFRESGDPEGRAPAPEMDPEWGKR